MPPILKLRIRASSRPLQTGNTHFWRVIRDLDKQGDWSVEDVYRRSGDAHRKAVVDYVKRLTRAGIAREITTAPPRRYELLSRPAAVPIINRDGTIGRQGAGVRQMWTAIRALRTFTYRDLVVAATTEEVSVEAHTAKAYLQRLDAAGYLRTIDPGKPGTPRTYALKRSMDTGPEAPRILRTKFVWDPNRNQVMGEPEAEEDRP